MRRHPRVRGAQDGVDEDGAPALVRPASRSIMALTALICLPLLRAKSLPVNPHQSQQPSGFGQSTSIPATRLVTAVACG